MTRPHDRQREHNKPDAPEPELTAEVIQDLDVPNVDADEVRGGRCFAQATSVPSNTTG
ncbi:MAG: hypothetical protein ACYDHH_08655 [Solirubrobacteraceae bacterium]